MRRFIWHIGRKVYALLGPINSWRLAMSVPVVAIFNGIVAISGNRFIVIQTKYDFRLKLKIADYLFGGYLHFGETNPLETLVLRRVLTRGSTMIDVGAHMGWFALNASQIVGKSGKVIAIEPNPSVVQRLRQNCILNNAQNISIFPVAFSDRNGSADFWMGDIDSLGSLKKQNASTQSNSPPHKIRVPVMTLDTFVRKEKLKNIRVIKIDVEGADLEVLLGAEKTIRQFHPYLMVEIYGLTWVKDTKRDKKIYSFLASLGYAPYEFTQKGLRLLNVVKERPQLINVFFAPNNHELKKYGLLVKRE